MFGLELLLGVKNWDNRGNQVNKIHRTIIKANSYAELSISDVVDNQITHEYNPNNLVESIVLEEQEIPIRTEVRSICDILGLNPYHLASEGRALLAVGEEFAQSVLRTLQASDLGKDAKIVGIVKEENSGMVLLKSEYGGTKFLDSPYGEPIPRVC